jgi:hypothetical protein
MASLAEAAVADEQTQTVVDLAGYRLDVGRGSLFDPRGAALALRPKSFDLLSYLFRSLPESWPSRLLEQPLLSSRACNSSCLTPLDDESGVQRWASLVQKEYFASIQVQYSRRSVQKGRAPPYETAELCRC